MVALARAVYNPRPGELAGVLRDPAKLADFADRTAVEAHLFDAFILAAYRQPTVGHWTAEQAERWLVFLARHLEQTIGSPNLAWWQLPRAIPRVAFGIAFGFVFGLAAGLAVGLTDELVFGLGAGLLFGLGAGLAIGNAAGLGSAEAAPRGTRISFSDLGVLALLPAMLLFAAPAVLVVGGAFALVFGAMFGNASGFAAGFVAVLALMFTGFAKVDVPGDFAGITSPWAMLARDRLAALLLVLGGGIAGGLIGGLAGGLTGGLVRGLAGGLAAGIVAFWGVSVLQTAWPSYMLARGWLAMRHRLPWSLMIFLGDAHRRGVLRQAGAVYQFRHIELQHRLATRPSNSVGSAV